MRIAEYYLEKCSGDVIAGPFTDARRAVGKACALWREKDRGDSTSILLVQRFAGETSSVVLGRYSAHGWETKEDYIEKERKLWNPQE